MERRTGDIAPFPPIVSDPLPLPNTLIPVVREDPALYVIKGDLLFSIAMAGYRGKRKVLRETLFGEYRQDWRQKMS